MQFNDTRIQEFGKNDGIQSVLHCQEKFFVSYLFDICFKDFKSDILLIGLFLSFQNDYEIN